MRVSIVAVLSALVFVIGLPVQGAQAPAKLKVLIVSGDDASAHKWHEMAEATREALLNSGRFDVRICEDMLILESAAALKNYDLIFLTRFNRTGTLPDPAKENLLSFVRDGKGIAVSHLASASFPEWTEFRKLCGRYWVMGQGKSGHGPRSVFKVKVVNPQNPIMQGIADFETDDELYARLEGDAPINLLASADSDWSKKTEPQVFTLEYGKGRVFHETFGHDGKAILNPPVQKIIARGCEWAATGKVESK